jgi:hypothetical protein
MTKYLYTLENIHEVQDIISDLAKSLYGTRSACPTTPEAQVFFMNNYEEAMNEELEREAAVLKARSERDGIEYRSWSHYYDEKERRDNEAWERENAERQAKAAHDAELKRRFSPLPVVEAWEHGDTVH